MLATRTTGLFSAKPSAAIKLQHKRTQGFARNYKVSHKHFTVDDIKMHPPKFDFQQRFPIISTTTTIRNCEAKLFTAESSTIFTNL